MAKPLTSQSAASQYGCLEKLKAGGKKHLLKDAKLNKIRLEEILTRYNM